MKQTFLSVFVVLSLFFAPIAHAMDIGCEAIGCIEQNKTQTDDSKQETGKAASACHHCCNVHVAIKIDANSAERKAPLSQPVVPANDEKLASLVVGQPLKPPSHA